MARAIQEDLHAVFAHGPLGGAELGLKLESAVGEKTHLVESVDAALSRELGVDDVAVFDVDVAGPSASVEDDDTARLSGTGSIALIERLWRTLKQCLALKAFKRLSFSTSSSKDSPSDSLTTPSSDPIRDSQAQPPPRSISGRTLFPVTPSHRLADAPVSTSPIPKSKSTILTPSKGSRS